MPAVGAGPVLHKWWYLNLIAGSHVAMMSFSLRGDRLGCWVAVGAAAVLVAASFSMLRRCRVVLEARGVPWADSLVATVNGAAPRGAPRICSPLLIGAWLVWPIPVLGSVAVGLCTLNIANAVLPYGELPAPRDIPHRQLCLEASTSGESSRPGRHASSSGRVM